MTDAATESRSNHPSDPADWRERLKARLEAQRRRGGICGEDEHGDFVEFHADGTKTVIKSAAEIRAASQAIFTSAAE